MPDSVFNSDVSAWSVDPSSSRYVGDFISDYKTDYNNAGVGFNDPIYDVPAGTPDATISVAPGCGDFLSSTGTQVPVPGFWSSAGDSDSPMFFYSTTLDRVWEFWQFSQVSAGHYQACWGGEATLPSFNGVFASPYGESATGISYLATAVTEADVASGSINHALAFILPQCNNSAYPDPLARTMSA